MGEAERETDPTFSKESVRTHTTARHVCSKWKNLQLLCFTAISYGLFKGSNVFAWTYHYDTQLTTWSMSRNWCRTHYTDMVAIQNKDEITYLSQMLPPSPKHYWIGIRKINEVWTWVGTNKTLTAEAKNWAPREPNNKGKQQDCVEIYIQRLEHSGKWNDEPCTNKKRALCYLANCQASSCSQRGECMETIGNYTCNCHPGYYGAECEHVIKCAEIEQIPEDSSMNCTHPFGHPAFTSACHFQCREGFKLRGSSSLHCSEHGNWTGDFPQCEALPCRALAPPGHATMNCSHPLKPSSFMSMCNFSCLPGFMLNGSKVIECDSSGQWTAPEPICQAVSCLTLNDPKYGWMNCTHVHGEFQYNSTCNFFCSGGFLLKGSDSVMCQAFGGWTNQVPTCEAVPCRALTPPGHAMMNCSHPLKPSSFMSMCNFSCIPGFMLNGSKVIECDPSGQWTAPEPICQSISCSTLQDPTYGWMNCTHVHGKFHYNSTCNFFCSEGFLLKGSDSVMCQASGGWTNQVPTCEAVPCRALAPPRHATMNCSHPLKPSSFMSVCNFICLPGFMLNGSKEIECDSSGQWTSPEPICQCMVIL
ncbi:P-selectin-like [Bombina bombina]|uniref:P-selectin-like n=1 Tax=Bombina bombina TaxID=8345 RepID=UPI00235A50AD|nr:P-selectin-like [Bombina bombina]